MTATLIDGPLTGLDIGNVTYATCVIPDATTDGCIVEHTYVATDNTLTTYRYVGSETVARRC